MDRTLLEEREQQTGDEPASSNNNEQVQEHDEVVAQQQFRDLAIERAQPPMRLKLQPPVEYDGQSYSELILDFDSMIGKDFMRAEREFQHTYKADRNEIPMPEMKHLYHCIIAKNLANVPLGLIWKLPRRYYVPLRTEVLKACGSSPEEEKA
jgi:hypothetical protein